MLKLIRRIQFKRRIIRELEQGAWQDEISAGYSESILPDINMLIAEEQKHVEENNEKIGKLETGKADYDERKKLGKESDQALLNIKQFQRQIQMVQDEVIKKRAAAAEKRTRIAFIKKYFKAWK